MNLHSFEFVNLLYIDRNKVKSLSMTDVEFVCVLLELTDINCW